MPLYKVSSSKASSSKASSSKASSSKASSSKASSSKASSSKASSSKASSYEECRKKHLDKIMSEFESGKLRLRNNKVVKDRKQAIAIAINMAQKECMMNRIEFNHMKDKIHNFLLDDKRKISKSRIPLTNVIECRLLINYYIKKKDIKKAKAIEYLLIKRITFGAIHGLLVDKNIWDELHIIQNYFSKNSKGKNN